MNAALTLALTASLWGIEAARAADQLVGPLPDLSRMTAFPILTGAVLGVILTSLMLFVSGKYDASGGTLTISIMITIGMLGAVSYCLIYTIPNDDITPGVVGGLTAGFGAVVAHWLGRTRDGRSPPDE